MRPALSIEALIASVREDAVSDDPMAQLTTAREYANGLNETGGRLLDHFARDEPEDVQLAPAPARKLQAAQACANPGAANDQVPDKRGPTQRSKKLLQALLDEAPYVGHLWSRLGVSGHRPPGGTLM